MGITISKLRFGEYIIGYTFGSAYTKMYISFKDVNLILTGKIVNKPYAQADFDL